MTKQVIPVTYLCWGCGSSTTRYEETDLPIPSQEEWNLCPQCIASNKEKGKTNSMDKDTQD